MESCCLILILYSEEVMFEGVVLIIINKKLDYYEKVNGWIR